LEGLRKRGNEGIQIIPVGRGRERHAKGNKAGKRKMAEKGGTFSY